MEPLMSAVVNAINLVPLKTRYKINTLNKMNSI